MYTDKFIKVFKKPLPNNIFYYFKNPIYCCQMIRNIFSSSRSLMEEHFATSNIHNHEHYHNMM